MTNLRNEPLSIKIPGIEHRVMLEEACWSCKGETGVVRHRSGSQDYPYEDGSCCICHGLGATLTEAGEMIIQFLKRHITPPLDQALTDEIFQAKKRCRHIVDSLPESALLECEETLREMKDHWEAVDKTRRVVETS